MNMQKAYATVSGGGAVNGWSYTYTGAGGIIKISVYISCYVAAVPHGRSWSIWKPDDTAPSAAVYFYFTTANNHMVMTVSMHIDTRRSTTATTWIVEAQPNLIVDAVVDRRAMRTAEY